MYERHGQRPLTRQLFLLRLLRHAAIAGGLLVVSLAVGMWGYESFEGLEWRDAFENSAMLLGGMGPVTNPSTDGGKLFAGFFALYGGLVFIFTAGILIAPIVHRMLHLFHTDERDK
jgi:hypothetical protein